MVRFINAIFIQTCGMNTLSSALRDQDIMIEIFKQKLINIINKSNIEHK